MGLERSTSNIVVSKDVWESLGCEMWNSLVSVFYTAHRSPSLNQIGNIFPLFCKQLKKQVLK